jgi:hypothetical protein
MPAHVTLLYPFVDASMLVAGHVRALRSILGAFPPFDFMLLRFEELRESDTTPPLLYLPPEPSKPFSDMTQALVRAFPAHPPYGGQFANVTPHLTVTWHGEAPIRDVRDDVAPALPISARAAEAWLMRHGEDGWQTTSRIHLGREDRD